KLAEQRRRPAHLWLQTKDLDTVKNQQYRSFLADIEAKANAEGDLVTLSRLDDIDEFVRLIAARRDAAFKPRKEAGQYAIVCSNRIGHTKHDEFQRTVIAALEDTEYSPIIADRDDGSGQIRLKPLEEELSDADTVVVVCFDQEWKWARRLIPQLRSAMGEDSAKNKIFIMGPDYKGKGVFLPSKFKTVVGVTSDNQVKGQVA